MHLHQNLRVAISYVGQTAPRRAGRAGGRARGGSGVQFAATAAAAGGDGGGGGGGGEELGTAAAGAAGGRGRSLRSGIKDFLELEQSRFALGGLFFFLAQVDLLNELLRSLCADLDLDFYFLNLLSRNCQKRNDTHTQQVMWLA